jgi:hypothetical protein
VAQHIKVNATNEYSMPGALRYSHGLGTSSGKGIFRLVALYIKINRSRLRESGFQEI